MLLNFANFRYNSATTCQVLGSASRKGPVVASLSPFLLPCLGHRHQLEVLDGCLSSGANHSVGEKGLRYRGELSLFEAPLVLALQRGWTPSLIFRITFDHCYSLGSNCQSGQSVSHSSTPRGGPACPWHTSDCWALPAASKSELF